MIKKRPNPIDMAVLATAITALIGFGLARAGHAGVNQVIEGVHKVGIDVHIIGLKTLDTDIFKVGEKTAITIRNRPVEPPMTIEKVKHWEHLASFLAPDAKSAVAFPDPANPTAHDFLVTVSDEGEQTRDGYVVRGQKVKIGNMIDLEGFKYRATGVVVDIGPYKK
ncbi:MAG: DUF4330 domain-containing protein [Candidatus Obscuribacterales bacterium]